MALTEASTVYYGLQFLGLYMPEELKEDKLFVIRACCVPNDEWTGPMLAEASRIIAVHRKIWVIAHFAATTAIAAGSDVRTVAGRLGHADPSVTLRVYAHAMEARDRELAGLLGSAVMGVGSQTRSLERGAVWEEPQH